MIRSFKYTDLKYFDIACSQYNCSDNQLFVFEDKKKIKGIICVSDNKINFIYVLQKYQRNKIGSKLLEYVRRKKGYLISDICSEDVALLRFYQNKNFKIVNITQDSRLMLAWAKGCINNIRLKGDS